MAKEAIFFENDEGHAESVRSCGGINVIKVSSGTETPNPAPADNFYVKYLDKVRALIRVHTASKSEAEELISRTHLKYYKGAGIGSEHYLVLSEWLFNNSKAKYLILDWDRTLTQVEGILLPHEQPLNEPSNGIYSLEEQLAFIGSEPISGREPLKVSDDALEQIVLYLCGGAARVAFIRDFIKYAVSQNLEIIILTNNPTAINKKIYFETIVKQLLEQKFRVICSARGTAANGNKQEAIKLDDELGSLCGLSAIMPPSATENNGMLTATMPSTYRRGGGGTRRKYKRRTIKLRRFMRRLKATRHRRNGTRSPVHKP